MAIHQRFNLTPFCSALVFCQDQQGRDLAVALNKATFVLDAHRRPVAVQGEARLVPGEKDVFWGEPDSSSLRLASEIVPSKPGRQRGSALSLAVGSRATCWPASAATVCEPATCCSIACCWPQAPLQQHWAGSMRYASCSAVVAQHVLPQLERAGALGPHAAEWTIFAKPLEAVLAETAIAN